MSNKLENTKVVTFKEDYNPSKKKAIYKAKEVHYIHKDLVAKLQANGAKFDVKDFDVKGETLAAKKAFEQANK